MDQNKGKVNQVHESHNGFQDKNGHYEDNTSRDYLRILFRQKVVVITTLLTVWGTIALGLAMKTPVYEAPYYRELVGRGNTEEPITQSEIVKSAPVLERVVRVLALDQRTKDYEKQYAFPLKFLLIDLKIKIEKIRMKRYSSVQQHLLIFRKAVEDLEKRIEVQPIRGTNIFTISVIAFDPNEAAITANVISRSYIIYDLEQQLADLALKYGEKHPMVLQITGSIAKMTKKLNGNPVSNVEAIGPATVKVIEQANFPIKPKGVHILLIILLGLVISIMLGITFAFAFEYTDPTFKSMQEIEKELNLSLLGSIPRRKLWERLLIQTKYKKTPYRHFYQILADQFYLMLKDKKLKSILMTATDIQEGTSAIIANLGLFLSQNGYSVLLIDADFHHPKLHKLLKVENTIGFADILAKKVSLKEAAHTAGKHLQVVTAGKTELNPVVLFESGKVSETLAEAKKKYKIILIDCPKMNGYKDALVLARHTDASVIVVNEGKTRRQVLKAALRPLVERKTNILGVILNNRTFPIPKSIYKWV